MFQRPLIPLLRSGLCRPSYQYLTVRHGSLNSAIERGLRNSRSVDDSPGRHSYSKDYRTRGRTDHKPSAIERSPRKSRPLGDTAQRHSYTKDHRTNARRGYKPREAEEESADVMFDEDEFIRTGRLPSMMRGTQHPPQRSSAEGNQPPAWMPYCSVRRF